MDPSQCHQEEAKLTMALGAEAAYYHEAPSSTFRPLDVSSSFLG